MMGIFIYMFIAAAVISLARAALGPSFADRYLGIGAFVNILTLFLVAYAVDVGNQFYLDTAILLTVLSFVGTLAIAKYAPGKEEGRDGG